MTNDDLADRLNMPPLQTSVARQAARGLSNTEIANELGTSIDVVIYHLRDAKLRLGCRNRIELAVNVARVIWEAERETANV